MAKGPVFRLTPENALRSELKAGKLRPAYFFYGEEDFLTRTYADMVIKTAGADAGDGLNLLRLRGVPDMNALTDFAESMPFFAEHKCVRITDLDAEALDNDQMKALTALIEQMPDTTVLIIALTDLEIDDAKPKAKTKKLVAAVEKCGAVCKFPLMPLNTVAGMIAKKAAGLGCTLSSDNARFLAERCGGSLTLLQTEVQKLCTCQQSGEISRETICALVPRTLDASAYDLSERLFAGDCGSALQTLDDLYQQRVEPILILAAVSGAFVDAYRGRLTVKAGKSSQTAAAEFGYFGGRAYFFGKACTKARGLSDGYLNACMEVLYRTNLLMNSSKVDSRVLIERAFVEIAALKGARV